MRLRRTQRTQVMYPYQGLGWGQIRKPSSVSTRFYSMRTRVYPMRTRVYSMRSRVYSTRTRVYSTRLRVYPVQTRVYSIRSRVYSVRRGRKRHSQDEKFGGGICYAKERFRQPIGLRL